MFIFICESQSIIEVFPILCKDDISNLIAQEVVSLLVPTQIGYVLGVLTIEKPLHVVSVIQPTIENILVPPYPVLLVEVSHLQHSEAKHCPMESPSQSSL